VAPLALPDWNLPAVKDARTFFFPGASTAGKRPCSEVGTGFNPTGNAFTRVTAVSSPEGVLAEPAAERLFLCTEKPAAAAYSTSLQGVGLSFPVVIRLADGRREWVLAALFLPDPDPHWLRDYKADYQDPPWKSFAYYLSPAVFAPYAWAATFDGNDFVTVGVSRGATSARGAVVRFPWQGSDLGSPVALVVEQARSFWTVAANPDGGVWALGITDEGSPLLAKVTSNTTLDVSWGNKGLLDLHARARSLGLGVDAVGRIVVAYEVGDPYDTGGESPPSPIELLRVLPDGTLDAAYGDGTGVAGRVRVPLWNSAHIAVRQDGSVIVPGDRSVRRIDSKDPAFVRLDPSGRLDEELGVVVPPPLKEPGSWGYAVPIPPTDGCPEQTFIALGRAGYVFR
jgi:hypothetical protein